MKISFNKVQKNWAFYDWANSVYPLVITTAIFPLFYEAISTTKIDGVKVKDTVSFFGFEIINTVLISYCSALIFICVSLLMPLLSGIADYFGLKKRFLQCFCLLGSIGCASLYFFNINSLELSMLAYFTAGLGFWMSLVFYNAYLPEIAPKTLHDRLSSRGFGLGYFGSVLLLVFCLFTILFLKWSPKWSFLFTAIWWLTFGLYAINGLPDSKKDISISSPINKGFNELLSVFKTLKNIPALKKYLSAFFIYSMGVQTVMLMAVYFGTKEINWPSDDAKTQGLIISVIIIQIIAILGAWLLAKLSAKKGNIIALFVVVSIWAVICVVALWVTTPLHFYGIAAIVGLIMGGIQSLSRSTYSKLLPDTEDHTSFFSYYDITEKIGIVVGTLSFGFLEAVTGSMRNSIFALIVFFVVGLLLLYRVYKLNPVELRPNK